MWTRPKTTLLLKGYMVFRITLVPILTSQVYGRYCGHGNFTIYRKGPVVMDDCGTTRIGKALVNVLGK